MRRSEQVRDPKAGTAPTFWAAATGTTCGPAAQERTVSATEQERHRDRLQRGAGRHPDSTIPPICRVTALTTEIRASCNDASPRAVARDIRSRRAHRLLSRLDGETRPADVNAALQAAQ